MKRIAILGSPGSGKSRLAMRLAQVSKLALIHLDQEFWLPGWKEPSKEVWSKKHSDLIAKPSWILDGGFLRTGEDRIQRCDLVVLFNIPTSVCLFRIIRRIGKNYGQVRVDGPKGCPEFLDMGFLKYVLLYKRNHKNLHPFILKHLPPSSKLVIISNNGDIEHLLNRFKTA
ncbi:MAG: adenylate kinase [Devosiaceae bacterium]|nr:adenylate kinase [Devosiaceae bacterium]